MHRYHEAAAEFEHILAAAPANDYAHYCLGRCLDRMGNRRIALATTRWPCGCGRA